MTLTRLTLFQQLDPDFRCAMAHPPVSGTKTMTDFISFAAGEPRLADILADPIIRLVLKRDGLSAERVAVLLAREQRRLAFGQAPRRAAASQALACAA